MSVLGITALVITLAASAGFTLLGYAESRKQTISLEDYMVSRNQVGSSLALATVTASALGAWILFSPAEAGSAFGGITAIAGYCLGSAGAVLLYVFVGPRLRQIMPGGHSLNEYVRYRFGAERGHGPGRLMYLLTVGVMLLYMFVYLTAELTAIAQAFALVVDIPLGVTSLLVIAAVFCYTTYGGLKATILTDAAQFLLILPLLLVCFVATLGLMGGWEAALGPVEQTMPALLSWRNVDGLRFGATLVIAIVAAELFNQGNWQRVYACRDDQTVRRAFLGSALVILPLIFISGLLGLMAAGLNLSGPTAFFDLIQALPVPNWLLLAVILLALALVMSSIDTLLNGICSVFTGDLLRLSAAQSAEGDGGGFQGNRNEARVLSISRILTVVVGIPAIAIAAQGYSVLYLFFIADLICAALLFPLIFSLYNRHLGAANALVSSLAGIATGTLFFPKPDFSPLFAIAGGGDLLNSFAAALGVSMVMTLLWNGLAKFSGQTAPFSYQQLKVVQPYSKTSQRRLL